MAIYIYIDPYEVAAVFPSEPEATGCATVLMKNGHLLEVDKSVQYVMEKLRAHFRKLQWASGVAGD